MNPVDHQQISELLALHAFLVDDNLLNRLGELFTQDAVYDMSASGMGTFRGIDAIRSAAAQLYGSGHAPIAHLVTNIIVTDFDDTTATVASKGLMIMSDGSPHSVTHEDAVHRHDGGWRISRRVITPAHLH